MLSGGITSNTVLSSGAMAFVSAGGSIISGTVLSAATISLAGTLTGGLFMSGGKLDVGTGGSVGAGQTVTLGGAGNSISIAQTTAFLADIAQFSLGDSLDLLAITYSTGSVSTSVQWTQGAGLFGDLKVSYGTSASQTLRLTGTFTTSNFALSRDTTSGTLVSFKT